MAFLRDSIKWVTISGMMLSGVAEVNGVGVWLGMQDLQYHHATSKSSSVRMIFIEICGTTTHPPGRPLIEACVEPVMSDAMEIHSVTHRCEDFEEK